MGDVCYFEPAVSQYVIGASSHGSTMEMSSFSNRYEDALVTNGEQI